MQESDKVNVLCRLFHVHRSNYRYWLKNHTQIKAEDIRTDAQVKAAHTLSDGSAGARTLATLVSKGSYDLSRYRATKAMKHLGVVSCQPPKHHYKPAKKDHVNIKNHLNREFSPLRPNQVWCGVVMLLIFGLAISGNI